MQYSSVAEMAKNGSSLSAVCVIIVRREKL